MAEENQVNQPIDQFVEQAQKPAKEKTSLIVLSEELYTIRRFCEVKGVNQLERTAMYIKYAHAPLYTLSEWTTLLKDVITIPNI